ncbi:MAG: hypothetical protein LQ344_000534 [Seirophora lacunosa]|nr:MAG: hypothetical protein LQ344_000534 [Seirophora lacunosa]
MLLEQDSATNYTASTISFADPTFDTFLTDDNSSTVESQTTQNVIKQEQDNMTNQGLRQHEQHTRRETQQQHNTPRPGPPRINIFDQFEDTEFKELRSALAADQASASPFQLQAHNGVHRPCTPPNLINKYFGVKGTEYDSSHYSPMSRALTPQLSSFESSPEMTNMNLFGDLGGLPDLSLPGGATQLSSPRSSQSLTAYPSPPKERTHRRNQSTVTIDETDGTNEGTGITEDEISAYMAGPLQDNRYMCTYEGCNKLFGRKENIRSHIQTHLGDRQWRCNHCHKRFVRQHDLKRHAKIHTGQKPHTCPCGNGFARHDALTRHRQRNTCVGGFGVAEGIPQSPSKRGRPKKRPDMETRRDKAAKTRERALEKASGSSVSGSSVYSAASPEVFFEELTTNGMRNADNMVTIQSVEGDEVLEAINSMSPEMMDEFLQDLSKDSSPFSEFEAGDLFGVDKNAFDVESTYDSTSQWLL